MYNSTYINDLLKETADSIKNCPQIICTSNGFPVYFSGKAKNSMVTSQYPAPVYEYMSEPERKRFLEFLSSSNSFSDFGIKSYGPYKHIFAVKETNIGKDASYVHLYMFTSRMEMTKSGITSDFMYEIYNSYIKTVLGKLSASIETSVSDISRRYQGVPSAEELGNLLSNFISLSKLNISVHEIAAGLGIQKISCYVSEFLNLLVSCVKHASEGNIDVEIVSSPMPQTRMKIDTSGFPLLIGALISVLADMSDSSEPVKISVVSSGNVSMIELYSCVNNLNLVFPGGTLSSLSRMIPQCAIRLSMCDIIASRANYDVVCAAYMSDEDDGNDEDDGDNEENNSEKTDWILKFSIVIDPNPVADKSLKANLQLHAEGIREAVEKAVKVMLKGVLK